MRLIEKKLGKKTLLGRCKKKIKKTLNKAKMQKMIGKRNDWLLKFKKDFFIS